MIQKILRSRFLRCLRGAKKSYPPEPVRKVTVDEAVHALEVLTLHEEQAHNGDPEFIL